jgi:hypothetical protein
VADLQWGASTASLKTIESEYNDAHTVFSSKVQQARSWSVELQSWLRSRLPPAEAHDSAEMVAYRGWAETKADLAMMHMLHNAAEGRLAVRVRAGDRVLACVHWQKKFPVVCVCVFVCVCVCVCVCYLQRTNHAYLCGYVLSGFCVELWFLSIRFGCPAK